MTGSDVGNGERILISTPNVQWFSKSTDENRQIETLFLTNRRIYGVFHKNIGMFKRPTEEIDELQLIDIKIIGGRPSITKKWSIDSLGWVIEIQTDTNIHIFTFSNETKKNADRWIDELYNCFGVSMPKSSQDNSAFGGLSGVASGIRKATEAVFGKSGAGSSKSEPMDMSSQPTDYQQVKAFFCSNCGTKLNDGAKFCHICGFAVNKEDETKQKQKTNPTREQEYVGKILKCPNCGNVISSLDAVCSACGMHINGKMTSDTVLSFSERLMEIERESTVVNNGGLFSQIGYEERVKKAREDACSKKITLIRTFPIPCTVDEIYDFMLIAVSNINVNKSKNSIWNKIENNGSQEKELSDAWVQKMRQAYQKALVSFHSDPAFIHIKEMYVAKMRELNMEP